MCFRAFYTSIYNIRLSFIKIESKTGREETRKKPPRRRVHRGEVVRLGEESLCLGEADRGQKMVSGSLRQRASPWRAPHLGEEASSWKKKKGNLLFLVGYFPTKIKQTQNKRQNPTQTSQNHIYGRVRVFLTQHNKEEIRIVS